MLTFFFFAVVPVCRGEREELYGALKHETVSLRCEVESNPPPTTFQWTFNNSGDLNDVPAGRFTSTVTVSHLNYTPQSDLDYGTLACWGSNSVGKQKNPCVFQVVAAGEFFKMPTKKPIFSETNLTMSFFLQGIHFL